MGLKCSDHLAKGAPTSGVLVRSWNYLDNMLKTVPSIPVYHARFNKFTYISRPSKAGETSKNYSGLDLFYLPGIVKSKNPNIAAVFFQRPAVIYMMVDIISRSGILPSGSLPGWKSEGLATLKGPPRMFAFGIHQKNNMSLPSHVFVFSKRTTGRLNEITLPQWGWLEKNIQGINAVDGRYHIRIAESDGSPSLKPASFRGRNISPNKRCPDVLHDAWGVENDDDTDEYTKGKRFGSWHPAWDPCYWW